MPEVCSASVGDVPRLSTVLARAFADDPMVAWLFPEQARRHGGLRRFFDLQLRHNYLVRGEVLTDAGRNVCALWLPPNPAPMRLLDVLAQALVPVLIGTRQRNARRAAAFLSALAPDRPFWYLGPIGTEPGHRHEHLATAVLAHQLARIDGQRTAAYLECSSAAAVGLYLKLGFAVTEEVRVPDGGPHLWLMWREPRDPSRSPGPGGVAAP